jgi:hypothetical protein
MYRDEMVKIFGHGLQSGHKQKGALLYGAPVVVCPGCVEAVREKNKEGNILAVVAWIVTGIFVFGLAAIGVRPRPRTDSGCCFDHLPGVVVLELGGAQIAEG